MIKTIEKNILLNKFDAFTNQAATDIPAWINPSAHQLPSLLENYIYPVSSWPVIINKEMANELRELCVRLPKLLYKIPELYFQNDPKKVADYYYGGNELIAQYALICHEKKIDIGCRLDLTHTEKGFKVLEVNIGSSIGGWQVQSFEKAIRKYHPYLSNPETATYFQSENSQENYLTFLIDKILAQVSSISGELNVFMPIEQIQSEKIKKDSLDFFDVLLQKELQKRGLKGKVFSDKLTALQLKQGKLYLNNTVVHGIIILSLDQEEPPVDVFRAFLMDQVYFPDNLALNLYGDKRNLGLLIELAAQEKFANEDNELILKSIPWTAEIKNRDIIHQKETVNLLDFIRKNRENLVIKSARGYQGKDVFIGKFCADAEWEEAISLALTETDFIAQEFSDSLNYVAPNKHNQWTPHKLIWGAFGFGDTYGGVWVRMSEVKTDVGIINSATGAVEGIVYEMDDALLDD
ncbi:hypothetical protein C8N46_10427 [Kordia periserrulae]|uniref:Circularly permuted ATP-grasp superfamily protein n=1 Tax=Kordia periserrulae TaxID=701523 RepID=A0A2T6BZ84_9FLAO|nr:hypothetical protein [Kordia periserrulae]PTX61384.1 hypothetical protein C8N46_10427 [Kordia periserrulae]